MKQAAGENSQANHPRAPAKGQQPRHPQRTGSGQAGTCKQSGSCAEVSGRACPLAPDEDSKYHTPLVRVFQRNTIRVIFLGHSSLFHQLCSQTPWSQAGSGPSAFVDSVRLSNVIITFQVFACCALCCSTGCARFTSASRIGCTAV